eukprot:SM000071S21082  [mRNA]  locus=s71:240370:241760:- [translate_table: standard]
MAWLSEQEPWKRSGGCDHVFPGQHPNALFNVRASLHKSIILLSDFSKYTQREASLAKDVVLPYVHRLEPFDEAQAMPGEEDERRTLLFFMGARHRKEGGTVRDKLFQILESEPGVFLGEGRQNKAGIAAAQEGMRTSQFCLHPAGDTASGGRIFDAIVSICVPVVVSDFIELPFEDILDYSTFSIFVSTNQAVVPGYLVNLLRSVSQEKLEAMQEQLRRVRPYFLYEHPACAIDMIWRKIATKVPFVQEMVHRDRRLAYIESKIS